jgi:hypothetical protein
MRSAQSVGRTKTQHKQTLCSHSKVVFIFGSITKMASAYPEIQRQRPSGPWAPSERRPRRRMSATRAPGLVPDARAKNLTEGWSALDIMCYEQAQLNFEHYGCVRTCVEGGSFQPETMSLQYLPALRWVPGRTRTPSPTTRPCDAVLVKLTC